MSFFSTTAVRSPADLLLENTINSLIARLGPQRLLVISAHPRSLPDIDCRQCGLVTRVGTAGQWETASLDCRTDALPFENETFNMLILHHVISDGQEPELDEAQRVLAGNGQLLIVGRGRFGLHTETTGPLLPVLDPRPVCKALKQRAFLIRQCEGAGFRGRSLHLHKPWQQAALPVSDLLLIRGRHTRHKPVMTPLKFSQPQVAGVRSAALDGLSREAV